MIAGNSRAGYSGDGGAALNAQLSSPVGLAIDSAGDIFIADSGNNRVREVLTSGIIVTVAGNGVAGFAGDGGPAVSAQFSNVQGIAVDSSGNLFVADSGNNRVRKVSVSGIVTTVAGNGNSAYTGDGGPALSAQLSATNIAIDNHGDLFIRIPRFRLREISSAGTITTVAGSGTSGYSGDGGSALGAELSGVGQVAVDPNGNLYIADSGNSCIREVSAGVLTITTVAGFGKNSFFGDNGPALNAALAFPSGVALDNLGNVYIADTMNYRVRQIGTNGNINTVAGDGVFRYSGDTGAAIGAQLYNPPGAGV